MAQAFPPLKVNWPRSTFLNRAASPLFVISRRMALESVAAGVGAALCHSLAVNMASIIPLQFIAAPFALSTCAAASRQDIALDLASGLALVVLPLGFVAAVDSFDARSPTVSDAGVASTGLAAALAL